MESFFYISRNRRRTWKQGRELDCQRHEIFLKKLPHPCFHQFHRFFQGKAELRRGSRRLQSQIRRQRLGRKRKRLFRFLQWQFFLLQDKLVVREIGNERPHDRPIDLFTGILTFPLSKTRKSQGFLPYHEVVFSSLWSLLRSLRLLASHLPRSGNHWGCLSGWLVPSFLPTWLNRVSFLSSSSLDP